MSPAGSKQANALSWWFVLACAAAVLRRARAARSMGVVLFVALSMLGRAQAQSDKALAESLFDSGRELMAQRRYDEACAKLSESQRIDASSGTALNLALCWEQLGRTASAWAEYLSAARLAAAQSRLDRVEEATAKAHALEARLSYLTVRVESAIPGELLYRAQVPLAEAAWGIAAPVDPGVQVIIAKADGYQSYQKQVVVGPSGDRQVVVIPALMRAAAPVLEQPVSASAPAAKPAQARAPQGGGHLLAYVLGGIGIAALGASVGVGLWSKSRYDAAAATCGGSVGDCAAGQVSAAREDRDRAEVLANVSNAAGAVGVLGVGTAIVLFILSGDEDSSAARSNALSWTASATSGRGMLSLTGGF